MLSLMIRVIPPGDLNCSPDLLTCRVKPNQIMHCVGVFNHCQLKEACSHVKCFNEFVCGDSGHEITHFEKQQNTDLAAAQ